MSEAKLEDTLRELARDAQQCVGQFLATFKAYPPRQKPGTFSIDKVLEHSRGTGVTN